MGIPAGRSSLVQKLWVHVKAEMKAASWRSSRGRPTQSHSTSTDPHLQGVVRSPSPPTTDVYISNVMFDNSVISPSFYVICYVISRFYQIKDKRTLHGRYEGGTSHQ
jgi:hypothetical protein